MSGAPLTIADGHHRYETALKYRADHEAYRAADADDDPAWDYLLALIYPVDQSPPVLPTHRVIRGFPCGEDLLARVAPYAAVELLPDIETLSARMAEPVEFESGATGTGRMGLFTRGLAALLTVDRAALDAHLEAGLSAGSRGLDVNALSVIIEHAYGDATTIMAAEGRLWYVKDAAIATRQVSDEEASATFLLHPMPPAAIALVAGAGEVMPQKSTYFDPKAPTGLLLSPLEW